ncbi:hypothetical protein, partial [Microcoleus sp. Pol12B3]|uniref:hypothetical protein n=1 Tax=Microcoleus sp. Pol12B3 TaxID=3055394 RepID=UPI002FCEEE56
HLFSHRMVLDFTFFISITSLKKWYKVANSLALKGGMSVWKSGSIRRESATVWWCFRVEPRKTTKG